MACLLPPIHEPHINIRKSCCRSPYLSLWVRRHGCAAPGVAKTVTGLEDYSSDLKRDVNVGA